jgi:glycosyltransferase involved in cell wall biosynthesis
VRNPHTGFLVPYGAVEKFVDKINFLIEHEQFRRETEKNAVEWAKKFSWEESAKKFMEVINNE